MRVPTKIGTAHDDSLLQQVVIDFVDAQPRKDRRARRSRDSA